jgi:hypothetical protein
MTDIICKAAVISGKWFAYGRMIGNFSVYFSKYVQDKSLIFLFNQK